MGPPAGGLGLMSRPWNIIETFPTTFWTIMSEAARAGRCPQLKRMLACLGID